MEIIFTNTSGIELENDKPIPASQSVPDWYRVTESYMNGQKKPVGKGEGEATIKRCIPVFDAITNGYLILLPADVYVSQKDGGPYYEWSNLGLIKFHVVEQAPLHPSSNGFDYPKFINPWAVKTPKGYSSLITQPAHRDLPFTIMTGIVDTDVYTAPINFPFVLNDPKFEGLIPAGTPIAQVMPFKRESWKMKFGTHKDIKEQASISVKLQRKFFDRYKTMFWQRKEYK